METFNLNKYLTGRYIVYTDSGMKVDIIDYPGRSGIGVLGNNSILGKVRPFNSVSYFIVEFYLDGNIKSLLCNDKIKIKNLVMYEFVEKWFNIRLSYSESGLESSIPYDTEDDALLHRLPSDLDTIRVVYSPEKYKCGPSLNQLDDMGVSGIYEDKYSSSSSSHKSKYQVSDPKHLPEVKYYNSLGEDITDIKDIMMSKDFLLHRRDPINVLLIKIIRDEHYKKEMTSIPDKDIIHVLNPSSHDIIMSSNTEDLILVSDRLPDVKKIIDLRVELNKEIRRGIYLGFLESYPSLEKWINSESILLDKYILLKYYQSAVKTNELIRTIECENFGSEVPLEECSLSNMITESDNTYK